MLPQRQLQTEFARVLTTALQVISAVQTMAHALMVFSATRAIVIMKVDGKGRTATARLAQRTLATRKGGVPRAHFTLFAVMMNGKRLPLPMATIGAACRLKNASKE